MEKFLNSKKKSLLPKTVYQVLQNKTVGKLFSDKNILEYILNSKGVSLYIKHHACDQLWCQNTTLHWWRHTTSFIPKECRYGCVSQILLYIRVVISNYTLGTWGECTQGIFLFSMRSTHVPRLDVRGHACGARTWPMCLCSIDVHVAISSI